MQKIIWMLLLAVAFVSLTSCSDINDGSDTSNSDSGLPSTPVPTATFSLSGKISVAPLIQLDSDLNDPGSAIHIDNGLISNAQTISNFSTVNGFATKVATGRAADNDRFALTTDVNDYFKLNLQKDQPIRLQVVDYATGGEFKGDLDLYLLDSNATLIDSSISVIDEFEEVTVPTDGLYYIRVHAFSGSSKYVLTLNNVASSQFSTKPRSADFAPNQAIIKYKNIARNKSSTLNSVSIQTSHTESRATLANFNYAAAKTASSTFDQSLKSFNKESHEKFLTLQTIKTLSLQSNVEYAEPNYIRHPLATPNDTLYSTQWHYPAINLPLAWDITKGARAQDVIVAVIDTGVFLAHEDLIQKLVAGYDFIRDPANARDSDGIDNNPDDPGDSSLQGQSSWHGTHVAGTIAAKTNNGKGIAGVSWEAKIMPLRVLGASGGTSYDTVQAVLYAAGLSNDSNTVPPQIADIINLSLGGSGSSVSEQAAFTNARNAGVIIIAAAGNENSSIPSFPASYDGVISVSATSLDNSLAPYSNFGSHIDIAAPGGNQLVDLDNDNNVDGIFSTIVDDSTGTRNSSYADYQGTSMSAPHMAGVVALMRAVHPTLSPDDLDALISSGKITTDLGSAGKDDSFGHGLIDALKAVQEAQILNNGGSLPAQPALISALPNHVSFGASDTLAKIKLSNLGDAVAQITSVTDDASWLTVAVGVVDTNKLGDYIITIDKTGLNNNASYLATITFNISTGGTLKVLVSMIKGSISTIGDVGTLYLLLIDSDGNIEQQLSPTNVGNGIYNYSYSNILTADYTLLVGSDVDNDLFICQIGESCGAYPTVSRIAPITLDSDKTNLNFTVDILSTFNAAVFSANQFKLQTGIKRLPISSQH